MKFKQIMHEIDEKVINFLADKTEFIDKIDLEPEQLILIILLFVLIMVNIMIANGGLSY